MTVQRNLNCASWMDARTRLLDIHSMHAKFYKAVEETMDAVQAIAKKHGLKADGSDDAASLEGAVYWYLYASNRAEIEPLGGEFNSPRYPLPNPTNRSDED